MSRSRSTLFLESIARFTVVILAAVSLTSSLILLLGGDGFRFSETSGFFTSLAFVSWLLLLLATVILNIAGSIHGDFSFYAMLVAFLVMVCNTAIPAVR